MSLEIQKLKDRVCIPAFLDYVRSLPCCVCGKPSTASHMISKKRADGSDALAVNACMPDHHVQSTKTSREILEKAGIGLARLHIKLWNGFVSQKVGSDYEWFDSQEEFENWCRFWNYIVPPPTKRKANFR